MAFKTSLWRVDGTALTTVSRSRLDSEARLEQWIANDCSILGLRLLFIGRQVQTAFRGRVDLLGVDADANLVVIELKRGKTPRDVVAQALDYASWACDLSFEAIDAMAREYCGHSIAEAFEEYFGDPLPDAVNTSHSVVIVASELDDSSERIVEYLQEEARVGISAVFFNFFDVNGTEVLARAWSQDPEAITEKAVSLKRPAWAGDWFVNIGNDPEHPNTSRNWDECAKYGFVAAGGGRQWSDQLKRLPLDARVFAYAKGPEGIRGYLGVGTVTTEEPVIAREFRVDEKPLLDLPLRAHWRDQRTADTEIAEYLVGVRWDTAFPADKPKWFNGAFAKQHVVCKLRDPSTLEFLHREFGLARSDEHGRA